MSFSSRALTTSPRGAQIPILSLPVMERLVIIEAPTGSGKTEAAVLWADRLSAAGLVDGMYFAVPTRSAATELHARISAMRSCVHPQLIGRVVRAVPGMLDTDHAANIWDEPTAPTWALGPMQMVSRQVPRLSIVIIAPRALPSIVAVVR